MSKWTAVERTFLPMALDFLDAAGARPGAAPEFYCPPPDPLAASSGPNDTRKLRRPGFVDRILHQLRTMTPEDKIFVSGHIGSGKSTELSRLASLAPAAGEATT